MTDIAELRSKRVVYAVPDMDRAVINRDVLYKRVNRTLLHADIYHPAEPGLFPTVVLVAGSGPWEILQDIKDWGVYRSYGELLAASGLGAVTFNHRSPSDSGLPIEFSPAATIETRQDLPPILVAKAGLDQSWLNQSIDRFVAAALRQNLTLDLMTHPSRHHSFDILDNDPRSREIIRHTIAFLTEHLRT